MCETFVGPNSFSTEFSGSRSTPAPSARIGLTEFTACAGVMSTVTCWATIFRLKPAHRKAAVRETRLASERLTRHLGEPGSAPRGWSPAIVPQIQVTFKPFLAGVV